MRNPDRATIAHALGLLLCASVASCGWLETASMAGDDDSRSDIHRSETLDLVVLDDTEDSIDSIAATHSVIASPCPHVLGLVRAYNDTSLPAELTLTVTPAAPIAFSAPPVLELAPGEAAEIEVRYDCSTYASVATTLEASFENSVDAKSRSVPVEVTVIDIPVGECDGPADLRAIAESGSPLSALATAARAACQGPGAASDPDRATCTQTELVAQARISGGCASCYVEALSCRETRCASACDGSSGECAKCSTEQGCVDAFYGCSGLNPLSACKGAPCDVATAIECVGGDLETWQGPGACYDLLGSPACYFTQGTRTLCDPGFPCIDGVCPVDPTLYAFAPAASYVTSVSVAPFEVGADVDGDGRPDNALAAMVGLGEQLLDWDPFEGILARVASGERVFLLEFPELGELGLSSAQTLSLLTGRALDPPAQSDAGLGHFEVDFERSFSLGTGAPTLSLSGTLVDGELSVGPEPGPMRWQVSGTLTLGANGVGPRIDGGIAAGVLSIVEVAGMLNDELADCDCWGLPPDKPPIVVVGWNPLKFKLGCSPEFAQATLSCSEPMDGPHCVELAEKRSAVCAGLGLLPFDQDADGDGKRDAASFALAFTAVSATIVGGY
ncbi:MAG: hypothetical protein H6744_00130 [Deltaproteobacteria bacterium]|nr:hypothetical protein [Deltaproteobacteria bacterium]